MLFTIRSGAPLHPETSVLQFITDLIETAGVVDPTSDLEVVEPSGGGLNVDVGTGRAYLKKSTSTNGYPCRNTATETVAVDPNASGNPRVDSLVLYLDLSIVPDSTTSQGNDVLFMRSVPGTPDASPVAPSNALIEADIGASNPYVILADIDVINGATGISNSDITDQRTQLAMSDLVGSSVLTTKGDLVGYSTEDTRIGVGANGKHLIADSSDDEGMQWLNTVINSATGSAFNTTSTSYVDIPGMSTTHTSKTGRVLVLANATLYNNATGAHSYLALRKDTDTEVGQLRTGQAGTSANQSVPAFTFYVFTGLTIGTSYTFKARTKVSSGTLTYQSPYTQIQCIDI